MSAIEGSTVRCSTLVDGTLRLVLDFEPKDAQAAFTLFGAPGRGVAVAALHDGRAKLLAPPAPQPTAEAPKPARTRRLPNAEAQAAAAERWHAIGPLCQAAIVFGKTPEFMLWINADSPKAAEERIKELCHIESRKELDENPEAGETFKRVVLWPYQKHIQARGAHV